MRKLELSKVALHIFVNKKKEKSLVSSPLYEQVFFVFNSFKQYIIDCRLSYCIVAIFSK